MSPKYEELIRLVVEGEMEKAEQLFHEIVVEKSRDIYEGYLSEEADEEMDKDEDDESMEEGEMDLEDSYSVDEDEYGEAFGGDATDDLEKDVEADDDMDDMGDDDMGDDDMGDMDGEEADEDEAMMDIKDAIAELEAAFAELEKSQGGDDMGDDDFGSDDDADMDVDSDDTDMGADDDQMMGKPAFEGKRMTREYVEKVGNVWDKNSQKTQADYVGAHTGDVEGKPVEGKSPISSGSGKPTSKANAKNLNQGTVEPGSNTGTSPAKVNKGINPESGEKFASGVHNVDGKKSGVKTLSNVKGGHGAEKKGSGPGPVGSGTGDKAGQTSIAPETKKPFLKPHNS